MLAGEELLLTEGTQKRDIIYISDLCAALRLVLEAPLNGYHDIPAGSGAFNGQRNEGGKRLRLRVTVRGACGKGG